jgi:uncharacterized protein (TIRG00374 family)
VSKPGSNGRKPFRLLCFLAGVALLVLLVARTGLPKLTHGISVLGWRLALVIALAGVGHCTKTWAWLLTLKREEHSVSFWRLFQLRLISEAAGQFGFLGQLFGDGLRVTALSREISVASRISSVTIDRGLFIVTGAVVTLAGIVVAPFCLAISSVWRAYGLVFALVLLGLLVAVAMAFHRRWPIISGSARFAGKAGLGRWLRGREAQIASAESKIFEFHREAPGAFWASVTLNLASHALAVLEVYLILKILGADIGLLSALILEALTKLVNVVGVFNPGNVGSYEGGNILIAKLFGFGASTGLVVAVARRIRAIFWAAAGAVCFFTMTRNRKETSLNEDIQSPGQTALASAPKDSSAPGSRTKVAIMLGDDARHHGQIGQMLCKVGTLPVILRNILGIRKAGVERIMIYTDPATGPRLLRELIATRRLPEGVEWMEYKANGRSRCDVLERLTLDAETSQILVIAGDTLYHPALLRRLAEWNGEGEMLAFTAHGAPIGIFAMTSALARQIATRNDEIADSANLLNLLLSAHPAQSVEVPEDQWQRISNEEDRRAGEQKLDRWLTKPTDGIYARFNRRISIPISRQLIKWPITPNMVSIFTLGVGFLSGVFFAMGHYWSTVFAALLSLLSSILDGSDGEVARLKLLESDFGCWLETVCDYLYYIFIFSGMAIGAVRTSGPKYAICGGLLLFGAVATILITAFGRKLFARERPEQYLAIWQAKAEKKKTNPILFVGRYTEFIIRRCFLPYPILVFALFGLTNVVIVLGAFGANCAWMISLYSNRALLRKPAATKNSAARLNTETCAEG